MKPNIVFILIDSFRADRFYGDTKTAKTPNLDKIMEEGVYFQNAIGCSDYTGPVLQSIFTGCFPVGCGIPRDTFVKLYNKDLSYLTILKDNGYHLYGHMEKAVCNQGFREPFENDDVDFESTQNIHNGLIEQIVEKITSNTLSEPWCYYIHLMDLHKPCVVPSEFQDLSLSERYDYNISTIDNWIGKIFTKLELSNTIFILTADHGEYISPFDTYRGLQDKSNMFSKTMKKSIKSLIPKSYQTKVHVKKKAVHNALRSTKMNSSHEKRMMNTRPQKDRMFFDDVVHIPLLIGGFGINASQKLISEQVRTLDIFPTIFEILNLKGPKNTINGQSLIPLLNNTDFKSLPAYMESAVIKNSPTKNPNPAVGIRTNDYKYFRSLNNTEKNVHLYDLNQDPLEDNNIADTNPEKIKEFETMLLEIRNNTEVIENTDNLSSDEEKELEAELKKLGYI